MFQSIILDIETIPCERQDVRDFIAKGVQPPATYKLADSIAKWHKEQGPAAIDEAVNKTGLDGAFGRICCVGYALDDSSDPESIYGDEAYILNQFNKALDAIPANMWSATTVVGHNVASFDLRFLLQRYIVNGIKPHPIINVAARAKPWEETKIFDTMIQFAGIGKTISLDKLCMALGIEGKGDISGADVWPMYQAGKIIEIAAYCRHDIQITREVYRRMTFQ